MIYRNPHVIVVPIAEGIAYAKNPLVSGGEQVINYAQRLVLDAAHEGGSLDALSDRTGFSIETVRSAVYALKQTGLLSEESTFPAPTPPAAGRSLSLWVHTSNRCNLGCPYCYVNAEKRGPKMAPPTPPA